MKIQLNCIALMLCFKNMFSTINYFTHEPKNKIKNRNKSISRRRRENIEKERIKYIMRSHFNPINAFLGRGRKATPWIGAAPPQWIPPPPRRWSSGRNHRTAGISVANSRRSSRCEQCTLSPPRKPRRK